MYVFRHPQLDQKGQRKPLCHRIFWFTLGIIVAFGMWLTDFQVGVLVCLICIPAALNRVKRNTLQTPSQEEQRANFNKIGMKIFIPALSSAVFALGIAIFLKGWNSLIGSLFATIFGITLLLIWNKENKIMTFMEEGRRFLGMASAIFIMPLLLSCLGAVFTRAGVGEVFASVFSKIIPEGNIYVGILAYTIGMVLFTIIMGNAFAAITVMTVGVGVPFVMNLGADPLYMITLSQGRLTEIGENRSGRYLKRYMDSFNDPRIYVAGEFGIGLNTLSQCLGNCYIEDESTFSTFHIGMGRNLALGGVQDAAGHFDLVFHRPTIYADQTLIMENGIPVV